MLIQQTVRNMIFKCNALVSRIVTVFDFLNESQKTNKTIVNVSPQTGFSQQKFLIIYIRVASFIPSVTFTSVTTEKVSRKDVDNHTESIMRAIFAVISFGSIVPNVLFLIAMLYNYSRIRVGHHNILLYNLIVSDILAGNASVKYLASG